MTEIPRIRLVDETAQAKRACSPSQVHTCDPVGVVLEAATGAPEKGLTFTVSIFDELAPRAGFGGMAGIDINNWVPMLDGFVFDILLQPSESPSVEIHSLGLSNIRSFSYPVQVFEDNHVPVFQAIYKLSARLVEHRVRPPPLSVAKPFQAPSGALRAFGLKRGAQVPEVLPSSERGLAPNFELVGSHEQLVHPDIDPNWVIASWGRSPAANGDVEEETLIAVGERGVGWLNPVQKPSLVFTHREEGLDSLLDRGDRGVDAIWFMDQPEEAFVEVERRFVKAEELIPSLLVCLSYAISSSNCEVGWQAKLGPSFAVNEMVQSDGVEYPTLECNFGYVVTSILERLDSTEKLIMLLAAEPELTDDGLEEFHTKAYMSTRYLKLGQFLPFLSKGVSLGV